MEERRGFRVKDLLIRLILIIIFIFLLIWLFPMPNLKPLNNQIFADNVGRMKDVAKSYYTTERLPKNIGDSKKMTLQEMIDNHLILPLTDSKGKMCSTTESYVEITKMENEYVIKVNLSCTDQKNYVIEHFGCYDICSDTCKALEQVATTNTTSSAYRTSRKATTIYTSRRRTTAGTTAEWTTTKTNKKIYEYEFVKNVCNEVFDSYTCPSGYSLVGDKCFKYSSETYSVPATETISIVSDVDTKDAKAVSSKTTEKVDPKTEYKTSTITAGYKAAVYSATKKTVTEQVTADEYVSYDTKGAVATTTTTESSYNIYSVYDTIDADVIYPDKVQTSEWKYVSTKVDTDPGLAFSSATEKLVYVDSWQELECPNCNKSAAIITYYKYYRYKLVTSTTTDGKPTYSCERFSGYSLDGTKCKKKTGTKKTCPDSSYTDTGSGCVKKSTTYSCSKYGSDYTLDKTNKVCKKKIVTYGCPSGTTKTSNPKVCNKSVTDYFCPDNMEKQGSGATATCLSKHSYYCPADTSEKTYTLNGTNCTVRTKVAACDEGYTLSADKKSCLKDSTVTEYTCEGYDGYTLVGDKCTKVINTEVKTYSCDKDFTLDEPNKTCTKTVIDTDTILAEKKYKTTCKEEYKWSTSTKLDGWSYTGHKRQIN